MLIFISKTGPIILFELKIIFISGSRGKIVGQGVRTSSPLLEKMEAYEIYIIKLLKVHVNVGTPIQPQQMN